MYIVLVVLFSFHFGLVLTVGCPRRACPECPVTSYGRINIKTNKQSVAFSFNFLLCSFPSNYLCGQKAEIIQLNYSNLKKKTSATSVVTSPAAVSRRRRHGGSER